MKANNFPTIEQFYLSTDWMTVSRREYVFMFFGAIQMLRKPSSWCPLLATYRFPWFINFHFACVCQLVLLHIAILGGIVQRPSGFSWSIWNHAWIGQLCVSLCNCSPFPHPLVGRWPSRRAILVNLGLIRELVFLSFIWYSMIPSI